ncbi:hypothetical protein [Bacteroides acidifaciens]|jgi:hypothetical protein|nr:hypothetical protein [Bacteroides acidifaciens]
MNKLLFFAVLSMCASLCNAQNTTTYEDIFDVFADGSIHKIYSMIDEFDDLGYDLRNKKRKTGQSYDFKVGSASYTLKTCIFQEWDENENEGFNVLSLYKNGRIELELMQPDIWTYVYSGGSAIDFRDYTDNQFFIPIKLSPISLAMVFLGWPYGGDMPYMTIVVATEKEANIVFNKRMGLDSIKTYPLYTMKVQTVLEEYDSCGKLCTPPVFTEIKASGYGTLQLKKQQQ